MLDGLLKERALLLIVRRKTVQEEHMFWTRVHKLEKRVVLLTGYTPHIGSGNTAILLHLEENNVFEGDTPPVVKIHKGDETRHDGRDPRRTTQHSAP